MNGFRFGEGGDKSHADAGDGRHVGESRERIEVDVLESLNTDDVVRIAEVCANEDAYTKRNVGRFGPSDAANSTNEFGRRREQRAARDEKKIERFRPRVYFDSKCTGVRKNKA